MMQKLKTIICGALTAAAVCSAAGMFTIPASAKRQYENCLPACKVYDVQNVLTDEQETEVNQYITQVSDSIDMYVAVYIVGPETPFSSDNAVEVYADKAYDALFNPVDNVDTDGVLLVINNSTQYDYLSTSGMGQLYYYNGDDDNRTWEILDDITWALKEEDYTGAIKQFCDELARYYKKGIPDDAYTYNSSNGKYAYSYKGQLVEADKLPWWFGVNIGLIIGIAIIVGGVAAAITLLLLVSCYSLEKGLDASNYVHSPSTNFYVQEDHFLREHTSKVNISSDSGGRSGGHSGGHSHSSGGHSHGGGGHHR